MTIKPHGSSFPMLLLTISLLLFHPVHGLELHSLATSNANSSNLADKAPVIADRGRNGHPKDPRRIGVGEEAADQDVKRFTIEDLLAVESQVSTAWAHPDDVPVATDEEQGEGSAALKREIHEIDVPKLDEAGLNYEFLYRAWEDLHGLHRYGRPRLHTQGGQRQQFHHREERKNGTTRGQYRFRLPHGKIQVVSYRQMGDEYLAKVTYLTEEQEHDCLGISEGCKLGISDIDIGEFDGNVVVGSAPGSSYEALPIITPQSKDPQPVVAPKSAHSIMEVGSSHQTPTIQSYLPPDPHTGNLYEHRPTNIRKSPGLYEHRPTNIRKSPGLFNEMKNNMGIRYGVNKQVYVGYGYGGGVPTFNYGPGANGSIIDFTHQVQAEGTKEKEDSPEGPDHANLENMKAYFDPILSDDIPIKYVPPPKTVQGHAEFFIPSNKIIKHFHSQEKVVGSLPAPKSIKPFSAFEQPSVTISRPPAQYESSGDFYGDDFVDDYYDYGEDIYPTTYKPPYIPIFVKRPEGPIDPNYLNLPSFSKSAVHENGKPKYPPEFVESSYESLPGQKHHNPLQPHLANYSFDSSKYNDDTEGRNQLSPTYVVSTSKQFQKNSFIEDLRVPPTAPQLFTPPINSVPTTHVPSFKSTIPPISQHFQSTFHVPHFSMPTTAPSHSVSTTFRPSEPSLPFATHKPNQHLYTPNTNYIYPSNSYHHSQHFKSQLDNIPARNSKVSIRPANLVKSVSSFQNSEKIHPHFIPVTNTQHYPYLPPIGIEQFVSSASHLTGNHNTPEQPPFGLPTHPVRYPNQQSSHQALPTKPIPFTSGVVPSASFSEPVTRSKIPSRSAQDTIEHSFFENYFPTGVGSSPKPDQFPRNEGDISSSSSLPSLLYDPHNVKSAPQYPPLGNPNYRTSIIRFPDTETDLRFVPAHRPHPRTGGDVQRDRIIDFKLGESQHSVSGAFEALDKFHAESTRTKNPILARKLLVSQRPPSMTRQINTHEVIVSKSSSSRHKKVQTPPPTGFIVSNSDKQSLRNAAETVYHLYHPPIAGAVSPERYPLRPRYPYPPYRIPRFVPLFYPFYSDVTAPIHPLARTLVVPRSRRGSG